MVEKKIFDEPQIISKENTTKKDLEINAVMSLDHLDENTSYRTELVEEEYYLLMENEQTYIEELSFKNSSQSSPENIEAIRNICHLN